MARPAVHEKPQLMQPIKAVQIGTGPLGVKMADFIAERQGITLIGAVDKDPAKIGKDMSAFGAARNKGLTIVGSLAEVIAQSGKPDAAILTTVSDMERITPQIEEILDAGIPVISTCEELSYPWDCAPELARRIDARARAAGVAVVGTGVNPGFLMDTLPATLTAVCQDVQYVEVRRFQDATKRRIPFQNKIGSGLNMEQFESRKQDGSLRHVGLTESMQFIAAQLGWRLDRTEDIIEPVVADRDFDFPSRKVPRGWARGVLQTGNGYVGGEVKIKLIFQAALGEPESYDEIYIKGTPEIRSRIQGGVNGDIATCAITINAVPSTLRANPGLNTMAELPLVAFFA